MAKAINSNHSTIVRFINSGKLFRGVTYFAGFPFNLSELPLISNPTSIEAQTITNTIKSNSHVVKAVFVYKLLTTCHADSSVSLGFSVPKIEFISKFDGVMQAQNYLKISHERIKN